jgi:hypothetical protein
MIRKCIALLAAVVFLLPASLPAAESVRSQLQRATQAVMDATAPGERDVWEHYTDADFVYVTEDNEVKTRAEVREDLKPLPGGSTGWIA